MKKLTLLGILLVFCLVLTENSGCKRSDSKELQRTISFDEGWRFLKDNPAGAENQVFDDTNWRIIDLPHDWSIEDLPGQGSDSVIGPFSKSAIHNGYRLCGRRYCMVQEELHRQSSLRLYFLLLRHYRISESGRADAWLS